MGKGGGGGQQVNTQVTEPPAYAKPFLEFGLSQAKDLFESDAPQFFPQATTVGFSPETDIALDLQRARALDPIRKSRKIWIRSKSTSTRISFSACCFKSATKCFGIYTIDAEP
jgi:hypothetical protein